MTPLPKEARSMEWDAKAYHRISDVQFEWGQRVLAGLELAGDETVLDAGCGSGRLTALLCARLPRGRVLALDGSLNMLEQARAHLAPRFGEQVDYLHRDLGALDLVEVADVLVSTATLHWVMDHERLMAGLFRALRPGGRLKAQCGGGRILERFHRHARALMASGPFAPYFADWKDAWYYADEVSTRARLERAGFEAIHVSLVEAPTPFPSQEALGEFLRKVVIRAHLEKLPDEALRTRFVTTLCERLAGDDPPLTLDYWRLNFEARRPAAPAGA